MQGNNFQRYFKVCHERCRSALHKGLHCSLLTIYEQPPQGAILEFRLNQLVVDSGGL